jgi:hypothetical protein
VTTDFLDMKIGDRFNFNGYPMELISVGNLLVADHQRVEIVILQKLEDQRPSEKLVEALKESGFSRKVQKEIIEAAIGREDFRAVGQLSDAEASQALEAIWSAVLDRDQLEEEEWSKERF